MRNACTRTALWLAVSLLCVVQSGCFHSTDSVDSPTTILVWHDWPKPQSAGLEELLSGFAEVYPHITVIVEYVPQEEMRDAIIEHADAGLGPDMIIESDMGVVADLHKAGVLVDLTADDIDTDELAADAVNALRIDGGIYGIPFAAHTNILYYNKKFVDEAPSSLEELRNLWPIEKAMEQIPALPTVEEAGDEEPDDNEDAPPEEEQESDENSEEPGEETEDPEPVDPVESTEQLEERAAAQMGGNSLALGNGYQVGLSIDFFHAFWGIRAFGGAAFDHEGNLTIDAGYVDWLKWLLEIQHDPRIILDDKYDDLVDAFAQGRTALMIGDSAEFFELQGRIGSENLGVSTLPKGAQQDGGGLLQLEVVSVCELSEHRSICCQVIRYLCNEISQRKIALSELGQIPVHRSITFNKRLTPVAWTLNEQGRKTHVISLKNVEFQETIFEVGNLIYREVLAGQLEPEQAPVAFKTELLHRK